MDAGPISLVAVLRDAPPKAALLRTRLIDSMKPIGSEQKELKPADLILRRAHACMRPSRRMDAGPLSPVAVLRDAPPKAALLRTRIRDARASALL